MKRAYLQLRYSPPSRVARFTEGLQRLGYTVFDRPTWEPRESDILVTWNRIREGHDIAKRFEQIGAQVIVTENASWGNEFAGQRWLTLCRNWHNCQGRVPFGDAQRWDKLGVELEPWRESGETVLLPQRGIGSPGICMPIDWANRHHGQGRIRPHPGQGPAKPLRDDLSAAAKVITWGSGAAILACMWGIKVYSEMPSWIGYQTNTDASRLDMLRKLAWAQVTLEEIESGEALARVLA